MPKLWNETIQAHRTAVRLAVLDTAAALVAKQGLASVTMSQIAEAAGIGRATLYKYFPDVEAILLAWHDSQITRHLALLESARDQETGPLERINAVLRAFAVICRQTPGPHGSELAALLHRGRHLAQAERRLHHMIGDLLAEGARAGLVRDDVSPGELASYCLHALTAARTLPSKAATERLVRVTMAALGNTHPA